MRCKNLLSAFCFGAIVVLASAANADYNASVLADGPYRYWSFNESGSVDAGEQVTASSSYALALANGAARESHATIGSGLHLGNALKYGVGQIYNPFYNGALGPIGTTITGSYAFEFWFKSSSTIQGDRAIVRIGDSSTHPGVFYDAADHSLRMVKGPNLSLVSSGRAVVPGNQTGWHHVVMGVFQDGSSAVTALSARIDGATVALSVGAFDSDLDFGAGWSDDMFGGSTPNPGDGTNSGPQFAGDIDELALYDMTGLTLSQFNAKLDTLSIHYRLALPEFQINGPANLGAQAVSTTQNTAITVVNNSNHAIALNSVSFSGANASMITINSYPASLAAGTTGSVELTLTPGATAGSYSATLDIATDSLDTPSASLGVTFRATDSAYSAMVLNANPLLYWNFDEAGATADALELVSNQSNSHLVMAAATRHTYVSLGEAERTLGSAIQYGGNGAGYSAFYNGALNPVASGALTGPYAFEFWMKSTSTSQGDRAILRIGDDTNHHPAIIYDAADSSLRLLNGPSTSSSVSGRATISGDPLSWHHVVLGVYQDGTGNVTALNATIDGASTPMTVGAFNSDLDFGTGWSNDYFGAYTPDNMNGGGQFAGLIDELAVYNLSGLSQADFNTKIATLGQHSYSTTVPVEISSFATE